MTNLGVQEILFSDCFQINKQIIEAYGAFDVSLVSDLPLFIDPFLLFNSDKPEYKALHDDIIKYLDFLRRKSHDTTIGSGELKAYYHFKEVKQTWLGFSHSGNRGRGLGPNFARTLNENFSRLFAENSAEITESRHLEKLCLFGEGVGKDHISDFTTNLIKGFLLLYTQTFTQRYLKPDQTRTKQVEKSIFNYRTESWQTVEYRVPYYRGEYVLLVPRNILTCDETWINRNDLLNAVETLPAAIPDEALRALINNYIIKVLPDMPDGKMHSKKERREAAQKVIAEFPDLIDYFIKMKEESGDRAVSISDERVNYAQALFLENFTGLAALVASESDFYTYRPSELSDAVLMAECFKTVVEEKDGYHFFYDSKGAPVSNEEDLRIAQRFCWRANLINSDKEVTEQVPVDFKLASNRSIEQFLVKQAGLYKQSATSKNHIYVIFCFSEREMQDITIILQELDLLRVETILMINASKVGNSQRGTVYLSRKKDEKAMFSNGFALIIGISNYSSIPRLPNAVVQDAKDIHDVLCSPSYCGYNKDNVQVLVNEQATAKGIRNGFEWLASSAGASDTVVIFFSGHGGRLPGIQETINYLIPYDAVSSNIPDTAISGEEVTKSLRDIKAQRLLVFFDSCYSGGTGEPKTDIESFRKGLSEDYYEKLAQGTGRVIIAASRQDEPSYVLNGMKNSLFTHFLLEALRGDVRNCDDGIIRVFDIFNYVSERVPGRHSDQHPIFKATDLENNFPVSLYLGGKKTSDSNDSAITSIETDKTALRKSMVQAFSVTELEALCIDIRQEMKHDGINSELDWEDLGGEGKSSKVLRLIDYMDRRKNIGYLVSAVRRARPGLI